MDTLEYILNKYKLSYNEAMRMPIEIPNIGRDGMADLFHQLDFKRGVEIGVRQGEYSEVLCKANPQAIIYGVDPYIAYRGYRDHTKMETFDRFWVEANMLLKPYVDKGQYHFIRKFSKDALAEIPDGSLDFVYLDGNHDFQNVTNDIVDWSKKLKVGGVMSGHDYAKWKPPTRIHVYQVVHGYTDAYQLKPWFVLGAKAVIDGVIRDEARSWMWVNKPFSVPNKNRE